jgi:hypothetical protein
VSRDQGEGGEFSCRQSGCRDAVAADATVPESLLMQSLVQGFRDEFASHLGRSCPLPRELPFHKLVDWDATAGRFAYDLAYADKQPDWTSRS